MRELANNGLEDGVGLDGSYGMSLPDDHRAQNRGMPNCRDETCGRLQARTASGSTRSRLGYREFGRIDDYPVNEARQFFLKRL
jgi:hypothetical protein